MILEGFINRCIIPYINEGLRMLNEGIEPALIENSAKHIGMPVGPLQLLMNYRFR